MEPNLLLEQYGKFKKLELEESPYRCLLNTHIELNPHQINAFIAAIQSLQTGGIVLADEVGLGKTIEAGLVIKYVIDTGAKKILIALPATLRKQWEVELQEKFGFMPQILDRMTVEKDFYEWKAWIEDKGNVRIVITSYDYASKLMKRFPQVLWDFVVIDEAHNLRNVFKGTKRAKNLYEQTKGVPKILLTATPLQNSLDDLHGLISFIDPRIFGDERSFKKRYVDDQNYEELKRELNPVIYRTLRRDVAKYMDFKRRECHTVDFDLSMSEIELYERVNEFLKKDILYSIPTNNKRLIILVIRKLLASSSFALIETFEVLRNRLQKLYEGTKSAKAQEGFDLFWSFVEDEMEEDEFEEEDDEEELVQKQQISREIEEVDAIIGGAMQIKTNAKLEALKTALDTAFSFQEERGIPQKVVVFTESKRTQKYIAEELRRTGYRDDDILLFNGEFTDSMTKKIYEAWQSKNFGNTNYGRSVEYKHAIVDYFRDNAKVLIVTDAGSEGLNLQFCNTVINYDLPWNPQKIEQRIGGYHRYGQKNDVVAINLLNTSNEADKRVYDILSNKFELFDGVFGASDVALGALESGTSFEKTILEIYQTCNTVSEFNKEFNKLDRKLEARRNKKAKELRSLLLSESSEAKGESLEKTKKAIDRFLHDVEYWDEIDESGIGGEMQFWKIDGWGEEHFGSHGLLFIGAFCDSAKMLFPVTLLCDDQGDLIDFDEADIVPVFEETDDIDIKYYKPEDKEMAILQKVYDRLIKQMVDRHKRQVEPILAYNKRKVENWIEIQKEQLNIRMNELIVDINQIETEASAAKDFLQKVDIKKKADKKRQELQKLQLGFHKRVSDIQESGNREIEEFNNQYEINPILRINVVLKF